MTQYRAKRYFMVETEHITVEIEHNTKWQYLGRLNDYIRLHRKGVFIDIPKDTFERYFVELKEQK